MFQTASQLINIRSDTSRQSYSVTSSPGKCWCKYWDPWEWTAAWWLQLHHHKKYWNRIKHIITCEKCHLGNKAMIPNGGLLCSFLVHGWLIFLLLFPSRSAGSLHTPFGGWHTLSSQWHRDESVSWHVNKSSLLRDRFVNFVRISPSESSSGLML